MLIPNYIFPPNIILMNRSLDYLMVQVIRQLSELEIADIIKQNGGKLSAKELSILTNTNEESLSRMLRAVSSKGIFHHHGNGIYSNNRLSSVLRKDHPNSVKYFFELHADESYKAAAHLDQALKYPNGWDDMDVDNIKEQEFITPWYKAYGIKGWKFYDLPENKYRRIRFDKAMASGSGFIGDGIFVDYDWGLNENSTAVDVDGGNGGVMLELLNRYKTKGVIFDLPQVMENTRKIWNEEHKEFLDRVKFFPGSFFEDHPPQADVYFLRWILHDWSDTLSVKILKNLRSSISSNSTTTSTRLIILESILDDSVHDSLLTQIDMIMLTFDFGKERTLQNFIKILKKSGWKYVKHVNCRGPMSLIEAVPDFD
ncbi:O-methyltransferase-domain-containing protein [Glomus cerebriforme]|uniref:O-methyltransferase-domain-containing protein n=1 Tax=Glomus cerebriforme TaxID=658196 RepID=A0A397SEP8_9GLOM|nr:O-methyltransferase-domain-containing protein [Glomus cerebriforme]